MSIKSCSAVENDNRISNMKAWLLAARPRTLPVSLPPILLGAALALTTMQNLDAVLLIFCLLCSLCIQVGTNFVNDALDFKKGADREGRLGPERMTQGGYLSFRQVMTAGGICFTLAMLCGIPLILAGGWPIVLLLCLSVACGYLYTGGPYPLAYTGLSDFFVLLFFGWVATGIVYYLQTGTYGMQCFIAATQIGMLAIVPHAINNLRDVEADRFAGKRTLAVRFGQRFARWEITVFSLIPFLIGLYWMSDDMLFAAFFPFICLPVVVRNVQAVWAQEPSKLYNEFLARSALCELIFGSLLSLGILLG